MGFHKDQKLTYIKHLEQCLAQEKCYIFIVKDKSTEWKLEVLLLPISHSCDMR